MRIPIGTLCVVLIDGSYSGLAGSTGEVVGHIATGSPIWTTDGDIGAAAAETHLVDVPSHPPRHSNKWAIERRDLLPITPDADILDMEAEKVKELVT